MSSTAPEPRIECRRCEDCAFTAGTKANSDDLTRLKARLCVETGEPFYCHEDVIELVKNGMPYSEALKLCAPNDPTTHCAGWQEAVAKRGEAGTLQTGWKRDVSVALLDAIYESERDPNFNPENIQRDVSTKVNEALKKYK